MGRIWRGIRNHPLLAAGLGTLLLVGGGFGAWRVVEHFRAVGQFRAAQAALEADNVEAAREHLDRCLKAWPGSAEVHFLAARAARRGGDLPNALRRLDAAEKLQFMPEAIALERKL